MVPPEHLGDVVGLVVAAGGDGPADRGVGDVDPGFGQRVVQHARVGHFAGEGDPHARAGRVGVDGSAAGGEEDRAAVGRAHGVQHRTRRRHGAEHAELQRPAHVVDVGVEEILHEFPRRKGRVLEHLDWAELVGQRPDRLRQSNVVADVGGGAAGAGCRRSPAGLRGRRAWTACGRRDPPPCPRGRSDGPRQRRGSGLPR